MTEATNVRGFRLRVLHWLAREKSEDPAGRPIFGLRDAHLYLGLLLLALGTGLLAGLCALTVELPLAVLFGAGLFLVVVGGGLFRLGRKP